MDYFSNDFSNSILSILLIDGLWRVIFLFGLSIDLNIVSFCFHHLIDLFVTPYFLAADALLIRDHMQSNVILNDSQLSVADINNDKIVNKGDMDKILDRYLSYLKSVK